MRKIAPKSLILLIVVFFLAVFSIRKATLSTKTSSKNSPNTFAIKPTPTILGAVVGDKDEHGCLLATGYTWCEFKNKCLRIWEEPCIFERETIKITNIDLGFSMEIPKDWLNNYSTNEASQTAKVAQFNFIPHSGKSQLFFSIAAVNKDKWSSLQKNANFSGKFIAEKDNQVYYSEISAVNSYSGKDSETYKSMLSDLNSVLATFYLID